MKGKKNRVIKSYEEVRMDPGICSGFRFLIFLHLLIHGIIPVYNVEGDKCSTIILRSFFFAYAFNKVIFDIFSSVVTCFLDNGSKSYTVFCHYWLPPCII